MNFEVIATTCFTIHQHHFYCMNFPACQSTQSSYLLRHYLWQLATYKHFTSLARYQESVGDLIAVK